MDRVDAESEIVLRHRDVQLDADCLNGLNWAERGILSFQLTRGDRVVAAATEEVRVLARDEWGGLNSGGELLKKDFDRDLSTLESELPHDESGIDVPLILEGMRREVRDIPGFEVVDESALGTFSFAKYLMWKDLVDRIDTLKQNRVVRHLIDNQGKPFESSFGPIPNSQRIDVQFEPKDKLAPCLLTSPLSIAQ